MKLIASARVRSGIIASTDQSAAAEMMLRDMPNFSLSEFRRDVDVVWQNRVSPNLLLAKYPVTLGLLVLLFGVVILWFGRLFRPRSAS
jgi:hypothetical protein